MKKQKEPAKPLIHSSEPARESGITGRSVIADHRPGSEALSQLRATMRSGYTRPILPQHVPLGGEQQCDYPAGYSYQQNGAVQCVVEGGDSKYPLRGGIIQLNREEEEKKKREKKWKLKDEIKILTEAISILQNRVNEKNKAFPSGKRSFLGKRIKEAVPSQNLLEMEKYKELLDIKNEELDRLDEDMRMDERMDDEETTLSYCTVEGAGDLPGERELMDKPMEEKIKATIPVDNPPEVEGFVANETAGDGNCFYHALFEAIHNRRAQPEENRFREQIANWLDFNSQGMILGEAQEAVLIGLIENIREGEAWTRGEGNVVAASNALGYTIVVHQTEFDREYVPHNEQSRGIIHLFYNGQNHWSSYTERALD